MRLESELNLRVVFINYRGYNKPAASARARADVRGYGMSEVLRLK